MTDALRGFSTLRTPQSEQADSRQVANSAGGYTFVLDDLARLRRFLILGTDGGTYYADQKTLTKDNAEVVLRLAKGDETRALQAVAMVVEVSEGGLAPKNDQALFALAVFASHGSVTVRSTALGFLPRVARTSTHMFQFVTYVQQFRGWGRSLRRAVAAWYEDMDAGKLAYQVTKYRNREGWTHRDVLRKAHPEAPTADHRDVYQFVLGRTPDVLHPIAAGPIYTFQHAQAAQTVAAACRAVEEGATWEMLPDRFVNEPEVLVALVEKGMGQTALIRQLPRLTKAGVLSDTTVRRRVVAQLTDSSALRKGRIHPFNALVAMKTYANGRSFRGSSTWTPVSAVVDALDEAFYLSFGTLTPTGKRTLLALDVSGSMLTSLSGSPVSAREGSVAMAMATARTETNYDVVGFTSAERYRWGAGTALTMLDVSPRRRMDDIIRHTDGLPFGRTDCALPMTWATEQGRDYDHIVVYTDNETWSGSIHPHQALRSYRNQVQHRVSFAVVGMTSTGFSIADPSDRDSMDVVGFDASAPALLSAFARGEV